MGQFEVCEYWAVSRILARQCSNGLVSAPLGGRRSRLKARFRALANIPCNLRWLVIGPVSLPCGHILPSCCWSFAFFCSHSASVNSPILILSVLPGLCSSRSRGMGRRTGRWPLMRVSLGRLPESVWGPFPLSPRATLCLGSAGRSMVCIGRA